MPLKQDRKHGRKAFDAFCRRLPFLLANALEAVLAEVKDHGMPQISSRRRMCEASKQFADEESIFGPLLINVPVHTCTPKLAHR